MNNCNILFIFYQLIAHIFINKYLSGCNFFYTFRTTDSTSKRTLVNSGVPRNFFRGGGSTNSVEDRDDGDLGAVAP